MKKIDMVKLMMESYCKEIPYNDDGGIQLQLKLVRLLDDMIEAGMLPPDSTSNALSISERHVEFVTKVLKVFKWGD